MILKLTFSVTVQNRMKCRGYDRLADTVHDALEESLSNFIM